MEEKIRKYVDYQLRFDERDDIDDLKSEITTNLIDRYNEYIASDNSPEEAYISAIKYMGDFSENKINAISEEYDMKPSIPDVLLMSGAILSIFGLCITMFSPVTGTLVTALSILLFSSSANYLYSYSQFVRKQYMDIDKHNMLLRKIFKYIKTSFVFWALSLSLIMSLLIIKISGLLVIFDTKDLDYIEFYIILFLVSLIVFLLIFKSIYNRLIHRYYFLTGTTSLKGKIQDGYEFLYGNNQKNIILTKEFILILGLFMLIPQLMMTFILFVSNWILALAPLLALGMNIILAILSLKEKVKQGTLILGYYLWLLSLLFVYPLGIFVNVSFENVVGVYFFVMSLILTIFVIYRRIIQNKQSRCRDI